MVDTGFSDRDFGHAKQVGARIVKPPNNMPFGKRQYVAEDLSGCRWVFPQSVADVAPEKWGCDNTPIQEIILWKAGRLTCNRPGPLECVNYGHDSRR
jgi:hypothetical protein